MDNFETKPAPAAASDSANLQQQIEALRSLVVSVLILTVIISGAFNAYLWRQVRFASQDVNAARPQVNQLLAEYNKVQAPVINDFVKRLVDFSKVHQDFAPILAKYGIKPTAAPATGLTPTGAAPAKK